jgi:hypothetical protein
MVKVSTRRTVQWAGVEFQPNLRQPVKPIRLGVVLIESKPRAKSTTYAVIGRMPIIESLPPEFADVGEVTLHIAAHWVDSMFNDMRDAGYENPFEKLAERWKWNLYLRDVKRRSVDHRPSFDLVTRQLYEEYVRVPFNEPAAPRLAVPLNDVPPAWQIEGLNCLRFGQHRAL